MNDFERARRFIRSHDWHFAKTMAHIPHWYCLRSEHNDHAAFKWFVSFIRENSREGKFYSKTYHYFYLDGYKYWDMDPTPEACDLVNRDKYKKDFISDEPYSERPDGLSYNEAVASPLLPLLKPESRIADLQCGDGEFVKWFGRFDGYKGVDNRTKYLAAFRECEPKFTQERLFLERAGNLSYEQQDIIVSLNAEMLDADDLKRVVNSTNKSANVLLFSRSPLAPFQGLELFKNKNYNLLTNTTTRNTKSIT
jgi:hypothetical protein